MKTAIEAPSMRALVAVTPRRSMVSEVSSMAKPVMVPFIASGLPSDRVPVASVQVTVRPASTELASATSNA